MVNQGNNHGNTHGSNGSQDMQGHLNVQSQSKRPNTKVSRSGRQDTSKDHDQDGQNSQKRVTKGGIS